MTEIEEDGQSLAPWRLGCVASVPSRTSISVLDMNAFGPGHPGGGNLGFAIGARTRVRVSCSDDEMIDITASVQPTQRIEAITLVRHALELWRSVHGTRSRFAVDVQELVKTHIGLASSASLQLATLAAVNWVCGLPESEERLRIMVATGYREADGDRLVPGFTTGLSSFLNFYGGFAVVDEVGTPVVHLRLPAWSFLVAVVPGLIQASHGDRELHVLMNEGRHLDAVDAEEKRKLIWAKLLPAVEGRNLRDIGATVAKIQRVGSKRAEIALHGTALNERMDAARCNGVECLFLSAVGPGVVAIADRSANDLEASMISCGFDVLIKGGTLDNTGLTIEAI